MHFKIDENLPLEVAEAFLAGAHEAETVAAEGLQGSQDSAIAELCAREDRVLVTLDLGFADIRHYPPQSSPGHIVLRLSRLDKNHIVSVVRNLIPLLDQESVSHRLWIVEDNQVRIRGPEE